MKKVTFILAVICTLALIALAQVDFPDGTTFETGRLHNVMVVQSLGSPTDNGTALRRAMDTISEENITKVVIQLAVGIYDLGEETLTLRPHTTIRGVARQASVITGSGEVVVEGGDETVMRDLQLKSSTAGTLFRIQNELFTDFYRVSFFMLANGGISSTGIQVRSGAEIDLVACDLSGDMENSNGSVTGLSVSGDESTAYLSNTIMDLIELSQTGALKGIETDDGATVEVTGGDVLVERETDQATGAEVIGAFIGSGSRLTLKNTSVMAYVNTSNENRMSTAVSNQGGLLAFSTLFQGTVPTAKAWVSETDHVTLSQSANNFVDL
jgi:hypothetical protein